MLFAALVSALVLAVPPANATLTAVAGVPVSCTDDATWSVSFPSSVQAARGLYDTQSHQIYLRQAECDRLALMIAGARPSNIRYQYDFASALFLFAHEVAHSRGADTENGANCTAGLSFVATARSLGVGPAYSRVLADYLVNAGIPSRCYPK